MISKLHSPAKARSISSISGRTLSASSRTGTTTVTVGCGCSELRSGVVMGIVIRSWAAWAAHSRLTDLGKKERAIATSRATGQGGARPLSRHRNRLERAVCGVPPQVVRPPRPGDRGWKGRPGFAHRCPSKPAGPDRAAPARRPDSPGSGPRCRGTGGRRLPATELLSLKTVPSLNPRARISVAKSA